MQHLESGCQKPPIATFCVAILLDLTLFRLLGSNIEMSSYFQYETTVEFQHLTVVLIVPGGEYGMMLVHTLVPKLVSTKSLYTRSG